MTRFTIGYQDEDSYGVKIVVSLMIQKGWMNYAAIFINAKPLAADLAPLKAD
jgi:hypothetical protein